MERRAHFLAVRIVGVDADKTEKNFLKICFDFILYVFLWQPEEDIGSPGAGIISPVVSGNQTLVLQKSSQCSLTAEPFF